MSIDLTEVREVFFEESFEGLDGMESSLLNFDIGTVDQEQINSIFRVAHSIKGGAGIFKFEQIINFAHVAETLLGEMRDGQHTFTQALIDLLLNSVDAMRMMLTAFQENTDYDVQKVQDCQTELQNALKTSMEGVPTEEEATAIASSQPLLSSTSEEKPLAEENSLPSTNEATLLSIAAGWHIVFKPKLSMLKTGNDPINLFHELGNFGHLEVKVYTHQVPAFADYDPHSCYLSWELVLYTHIKRAIIEEVFEWIEDESEIHITALAPPKEQASYLFSEQKAKPLPKSAEGLALIKNEEPSLTKDKKSVIVESKKPPPTEDKKSVTENNVQATPLVSKNDGEKTVSHHTNEANSIRVSIDKIDSLINVVGELVITQSMLEQIGEEIAECQQVTKLLDGLSQLERNTRELQERVMRIRMLPISFSFNRFPRLVHDLNLQLGKKVELKLSGEHTELDKTVLEKMSDPLVHLVRNAVDHGIEIPAQRQAAGKPETGYIHLHAFHQGGSIVIQISDDGAGFDLEKIRIKAVQTNLINSEDSPTDEQLYGFIFQPGFSTVTQVSNVSGRGVGMDVVRRNIRALGGTIEVSSQLGVGSTFTIRLPLTLAILDGQLVRVGKNIYILSLLSIIESLRVKPALVSTLVGSAEVYRLRDEYVPILRLYELFGITSSTTKLDEGLLVIVEGDGQKIGLFVDELLSQQQIVIKSLESNYKKIPGISGATILGDGCVALILDVAGLIQVFQN